MFSKASSVASAWSTSARIEIAVDEESSVIGDAAVIVGDLTSEGEIEVQGTVEGNIRCRRAIVGESGEVHGEIVAEFVDIRGSVEGPVVASSVAVARTARIIGHITHRELTIEPGAYLEGRRPWRLHPLEDLKRP
ncbi:MAG: polymer-forming cytoskeletal protein [Kiloniellales bacterium]|jgi:cytoskeletal protein CcmA (bactofilin family)|nr:polymer-forming cytoskeletal protein [Kiloniellales bacterium]